jgi:hypothetical protein
MVYPKRLYYVMSPLQMDQHYTFYIDTFPLTYVYISNFNLNIHLITQFT